MPDEITSPEKAELRNYIEQLIEGTRSGSLEWNRANPSTYTWDSNATNARLVLQRSERMVIRARVEKIAFYIFQAFETTPTGTRRIMLSVDTSEDHDIQRPLEELYQTIRSGISRKGLDFLKRSIPS